MADLFDLATSQDGLRAGLERAMKNQAGPGPDGVTILDFFRGAAEHLERLSTELRGGSFQPQPGQRIELPRPDGRVRRVVRLSVRDRVVHHALAIVCGRHLDSELHDFAYAYRPGRSGRQALDALEDQVQGGKIWFFRADIENFFDQIDHALIGSSVGVTTGEVALVSLVELLLKAGQFNGDGLLDEPTGAPQGSALSPFLANLVLSSFDAAIEEAGLCMVRYGDDLCIPVASCHEAMQAEARVRGGLDKLGLRLSEPKVKIVQLREGLDFLGFRLDENGRRPGQGAQESLQAKLQRLLDSGRPDVAEELDNLLRGWLGYYGPLGVLELPESIRGRAEQLEAAWVERRQQQDLQEPCPSREVPPGALLLPDEDLERLARQGRFDEAEEGARPRPPEAPAAPAPGRRALPVVAPLAGCPRAQELYAGCNMLRALVDRAVAGQGLLGSERYLVADLLGRLGDEAERSFDAVLRHLVDHKPGMARRYLGRIFPMPTSCARIRQRMPELAAEVGCACQFRLQAGAYPTPVLHVLGAAEIPGLEGRVQKATLKRSAAKTLMDSINAGHKDLGDKAAALCTRLADLRRQQRLLVQEVERAEQQLGELIDEVGAIPLETPAGTLRRLVDEQGHARFILEV